MFHFPTSNTRGKPIIQLWSYHLWRGMYIYSLEMYRVSAVEFLCATVDRHSIRSGLLFTDLAST
ncbi:hypothetical protein BDD14_6357 [Edaphobacter modestus]|uniref:Uncharacterized protein n=1 Tax=Edaphobacter modestus TaxID=388466 RepID=A0A4Q7Y143_9BACT|nr:hypothetical protein BDD14_6357 [Edaphobacter modestus]